MVASGVPQAVQSCHDLLLWLIPQLDKFPRSRRFTLGERLEARVLETLVETAYIQHIRRMCFVEREGLGNKMNIVMLAKVGLRDGQLNVKRRALAQFTLHAYFSLMGRHGIFDDFEA